MSASATTLTIPALPVRWIHPRDVVARSALPTRTSMPFVACLRLGESDRADLRIGERDPRHGPVVGLAFGLAAQDVGRSDARLIEARRGCKGRPRSRRRSPRSRWPRGSASSTSIASASGSSPTFSSPMSANRFLRPVVDDEGCGGDQQVESPTWTVKASWACSTSDGLDPGAHVDAVCAQSLGDDLAGLRLFRRQQLVGHLEQRDLGAEPCPDLGELHTDRATSEHDHRLRQSFPPNDVSVGLVGSIGEPPYIGRRRVGSGGDHDPSLRAVGDAVDLDLAVP